MELYIYFCAKSKITCPINNWLRTQELQLSNIPISPNLFSYDLYFITSLSNANIFHHALHKLFTCKEASMAHESNKLVAILDVEEGRGKTSDASVKDDPLTLAQTNLEVRDTDPENKDVR